ncbi:hypothetical protein BD408DRAFT_480910 [Parasitella parasitica]|nr:hypothetical protein BD408DRAFT_480910 [Parasitella parasitica]
MWTRYSYRRIHIRGKLQFQSFFYDTLQSSLMAAPYSAGHHIRKLVVENGHIEPFMLGQLPQLCPYLEVFMFDGVVLSQAARRESFQHYQQRRNQEELDKVRHHFALWKHMRELVEVNGIAVAHALLQQTTRHLTSLSVQFNNQNDRTNLKTSLVASLHHAPNLQALSIECIYLTCKELESMHDSCPSLSALCLSDTILLPMPAAHCKKHEIKPAIGLRKFRFINGSFCNDAPRWLNYISQKYIYARCLDIGSCTFFAEARESQQLDSNNHEEQLLQIAESCTKLEALNLQSFRLQTAFFQMLDQKAVFLSQLTLGDGLTNSLAYELKGLLKSKQRDSIKTLFILGWPLAADIRGSHMLMVSLGQCTHITKLHLSLGRHLHRNESNPATSTIYLDFLLTQCPKLTCLTVADATLATIAASVTPAFKQYTLRSLQLENVLIDSGRDAFHIVATHCAELTELCLISTISSPVYHNTRNFNIYLPQHRLKRLVLDRIRVSRKCSMRLGYECCASPSFARHSGTDKMRASKVKKLQDADINYSNLDQSVYVSVVCKNIESLYLTGLHIVQ